MNLWGPDSVHSRTTLEFHKVNRSPETGTRIKDRHVAPLHDPFQPPPPPNHAFQRRTEVCPFLTGYPWKRAAPPADVCPCCSVPLSSFMSFLRGAFVHSSAACPAWTAAAIGNSAARSCLCVSFGELGATFLAGACPGVEPQGHRQAQVER